ncbi:PerC family transcriptional regulator [Brenneria populi]|uniref:PerC family transcriptional regulator n=1 Tax=Brenneria populi TaxID=1505588 RepID=UPI0032F07122
MIIDDITLAEKLEAQCLWRRAARQWLVVYDKMPSGELRDKIARRREKCINRVKVIPRQYSGVREMTVCGGVLNV